MSLLMELLVATLKILYYIMEAILTTIIPALQTRKTVSGQTVLITGAGSGLGRLMSLRFGGLGCRLVLWDIDKAGVQETQRLVKEIGATAHVYVCDLSQREEIQKAAQKVQSEVGGVDILVNNAGIVTGKTFMDCPDQLMQKTMDVNATAHFWTTKCFLPGMVERDQGHIVTIASSAGLFGVCTLADYCASKFAAVGFDESLRHELFAKGNERIHTTVVCPFFINTGMFDGVKTRFPRLVPILEPDYAVDRIMDAVLTNQHMLIMPRLVALTYALKGILPTKCGAIFMQVFGVSSSMDAFKGRKKEN